MLQHEFMLVLQKVGTAKHTQNVRLYTQKGNICKTEYQGIGKFDFNLLIREGIRYSLLMQSFLLGCANSMNHKYLTKNKKKKNQDFFHFAEPHWMLETN